MALFLSRRRGGRGDYRGRIAVALCRQARISSYMEAEWPKDPEPSETTPLVKPETHMVDGSTVSRTCTLVLPPVALVGSGVGALMMLEGWPASTSMHVVSQTITTVGWGDITVTSDSAKIFLSLYAIAILLVIAYYDSLFTINWMGYRSRTVGLHMRRDLFLDNAASCSFLRVAVNQFCTVFVSLSPILSFIVIGSLYFFFNEACVCKKTAHIETESASCIDTQGFEKCVETGGFSQSLVDIVYMTVISLCSIGFGDYHPWAADSVGTTFSVFWIILGVAATAVSITNLSDAFFGMELARKFETKESLSTIDDAALGKIEKDASGRLSRAEYLSWMLIKCDLISQEVIDEINSSYDKLDPGRTNRVPFAYIKSEKEAASKAQNLQRQAAAQRGGSIFCG
eukprot:TRINITY_DN15007_c0_g1_i1.p1 TRINITY_DN15007_c0_g1~~TRINITY_DN15007_c0_g1_i1.p1  ORF type:complete len:414 (+),score=36.38 TRINITY_DN15007_c0_g1_i1:46-1242(+)